MRQTKQNAEILSHYYIHRFEKDTTRQLVTLQPKYKYARSKSLKRAQQNIYLLSPLIYSQRKGCFINETLPFASSACHGKFMESLLAWMRTSVNWRQQYEKPNKLLSKLITIFPVAVFRDRCYAQQKKKQRKRSGLLAVRNPFSKPMHNKRCWSNFMLICAFLVKAYNLQWKIIQIETKKGESHCSNYCLRILDSGKACLFFNFTCVFHFRSATCS